MDTTSNSMNGYSFKNEILSAIKDLKTNGLIKCISINKRFSHKLGWEKQFFAPLFLDLDNGSQIVVFGTTSFRADRFKTYEWDSHGIKSLNNNISTILVMPNELPEKEEENLLREIRNRKKQRLTYIDQILRLDDLEDYIKGFCS